jgi:hypothetical protein
MSCMSKRAFIEVTGDDSDVVIFSLDQTQFVVQHANERPPTEYSRRKKAIANIKSILLL